jgi:hypothetical protein
MRRNDLSSLQSTTEMNNVQENHMTIWSNDGRKPPKEKSVSNRDSSLITSKTAPNKKGISKITILSNRSHQMENSVSK